MLSLMRAVIFLADAVASFFCVLFLLRFVMQALRVSFAGPVGHFAVALTNWAVLPLRKVIPGTRGYDWASLLAAFLAQLALSLLIIALSSSYLPVDLGDAAPLILLGALRSLVRLTVWLFIGALILQAVLSWVNPYSPLAGPADQLTRPLLAPLRRVIPIISGIDLSPLAAILLLQVLLMFL